MSRNQEGNVDQLAYEEYLNSDSSTKVKNEEHLKRAQYLWEYHANKTDKKKTSRPSKRAPGSKKASPSSRSSRVRSPVLNGFESYTTLMPTTRILKKSVSLQQTRIGFGNISTKMKRRASPPTTKAAKLTPLDFVSLNEQILPIKAQLTRPLSSNLSFITGSESKNDLKDS